MEENNIKNKKIITLINQYVTNNNCNTSNKSKDKETKSKQTIGYKYLIGNNEALNHLIYFTNCSNKTAIIPGSNSKIKSET